MASQNSRACMNLFNPNLLNFFCLFLLLGHFRYVDLCSVHHEGQFYKWAFNSQYGFAGNVLAYADRYRSVLQSKKMEGGFLKALTMSKLRSVYFKVFFNFFFFYFVSCLIGKDLSLRSVARFLLSKLTQSHK